MQMPCLLLSAKAQNEIPPRAPGPTPAGTLIITKRGTRSGDMIIMKAEREGRPESSPSSGAGAPLGPGWGGHSFNRWPRAGLQWSWCLEY